uniref:Uncharacterized protein n=1 Tax=Solanum lycopersicum TaxID=4081 RepID=A0A3Q7G2M2_SOLLC
MLSSSHPHHVHGHTFLKRRAALHVLIHFCHIACETLLESSLTLIHLLTLSHRATKTQSIFIESSIHPQN